MVLQYISSEDFYYKIHPVSIKIFDNDEDINYNDAYCEFNVMKTAEFTIQCHNIVIRDFIKFILKRTDGYDYKTKTVNKYSSHVCTVDIYCDSEVFLDRVKNDKITSVEINYIKEKMKQTSNVYSINDDWKKAWLPKNEPTGQPKGIDVELFDYQLRTLSWMINLETKNNKHEINLSKTISSVFKHSDFNNIFIDVSKNKLICDSTKNTYVVSGGILSDEMGLGKTITCIALTIKNPYVYKYNQVVDNKNYEMITTNKGSTVLKSKATLVVCPSHLTKQWNSEIKKVKKDLKTVLMLTKVNHDKITYREILDADFVIVSTQFLSNFKYYGDIFNSFYGSNKWNKKDNVTALNSRFNKLVSHYNFKQKFENKTNILFETIKWNRIIIDEAHEIVNNISRKPENVYLAHLLRWIMGDNKWYISGTPFNSSEGIKNVMNFLKFKAFDGQNYSVTYEDLIKSGLSYQNVFNSIFSQIYIRNTKESTKDQITIPKATIENVMLDLSHFEKQIYDTISKDNVKSLREICCNIQVSGKFSEYEDEEGVLDFGQIRENIIEQNEAKIKANENAIKHLDSSLKSYHANKKTLENTIAACKYMIKTFEGIDMKNNEEEDDCPICMCEFEDPVVSKCAHKFCYDCIKSIIIDFGTKKCPVCKEKIHINDVYRINEDPNAEKKEKKDSVNPLIFKYGTKLAKLTTLCKQILENKNNKIIVFSSFDKLLHMISKVLKQNEIPNVFCQGNVHQRSLAIMSFQKNDLKIKKDRPRVIMLSTEHSASGTNLTEATHIIFMEPISGTKEEIMTTENQAIGRAVRIGQENQVKVYRLITKDTIEEKIFKKY